MSEYEELFRFPTVRQLNTVTVVSDTMTVDSHFDVNATLRWMFGDWVTPIEVVLVADPKIPEVNVLSNAQYGYGVELLGNAWLLVINNGHPHTWRIELVGQSKHSRGIHIGVFDLARSWDTEQFTDSLAAFGSFHR